MSAITVEPMRADHLVKIETIVDEQRGKIRIFYPLTIDGEPDLTRQPKYVGECKVTGVNQVGQQVMFPVFFEIPAKSIREAFEGWSAACQKGVDEMQSSLTRAALANSNLPMGGRG